MVELPRRLENVRYLAALSLGSERRIAGSVYEPPGEVLAAYEEHKEFISDLYGSKVPNYDLLFHGTGGFKYEKEEDRFSSEKAVPILEDIISNKLNVFIDAYLRSPGQMASVSFTKARFYAKWYASRFNGKEEDLEWEYGRVEDWVAYYARSQFATKNVVELGIFLAKMAKHAKKQTNGEKPINAWMSSARNDIPHNVNAQDIMTGRSTIPSNFGAIIVCKSADISTVDVSVVNKYEVRTMKPILQGQISAIEVPLSKVDKVRTFCQEKGVDIKIIPMECVDLHFSRFPLTSLTRDLNSQDKKNEKVRFKDFPTNEKQEIENAAAGKFGEDYHPLDLIDALCKDAYLKQQFEGRVGIEGTTLKNHTLAVMAQFEKYFENQDLPLNVRKEFFRTFLALHDIGKSIARQKGKPQEFFNRTISVKFLKDLGYSDEEVAIADSLLSGDPLGRYLKKIGITDALVDKIPLGTVVRKKISGSKRKARAIEEAGSKIREMAIKADMPVSEFFDLLVIYHKSDASSYTTDGGSVGFLNYLFDHEEGNLEYSPIIQNLVNELKMRIVEPQEVKQTGFEVSKENYLKAVDTLTNICEHVTGVPIPGDVLEKWKAGAKLLRTGDNRLDSLKDHDDRKELVEDVVGYIRGLSEGVMEREDEVLLQELDVVRSLGESMGDDLKEQLFMAFDGLITSTEAIKYALSAKELSQLNKKEGTYLIQLFLTLLPEEYRKLKDYPRLERVATLISRSANVFDTFIDMKSDYKSGSIRIAPSLRNRSKLLADVIPDFIQILILLRPTRELMGKIVQDVKGTVDNNSARDLA